MRRSVLICAAALALAVAAAATALPSFIAPLLEEQIVASARESGLRLSLRGLEPGLISSRAASATAYLPAALLGLDLEQLSLKPHWLSVLLLRPGASLDFSFYDGSVQTVTGYSLLGRLWSISVTAAGIQLAQHPQLRALGAAQGELSLTAKDLNFEPGAGLRGRAEFNLTNFNTSQTIFLSPGMFGLRQGMMIPQIRDLDLQARLNFELTRLRYDALSNSTSLGKLQSTGQLTLSPSGKVEDMKITVDADFSEDGLTLFNLAKQFLDPRHKAAVAGNGRKWRIDISGPPPGSISIQPVAALT